MSTYRGPPADSVVIEPLDAFTLVYHRPAGATHLLSEPAPEILAALAEGPADAATLLARLGARYDVAGAARDAIDARLAELVATGLVGAA